MVSLIETSLPLVENILTSLTKTFLTPLGLTAIASAANPKIDHKILVSGKTDIMKKVKAFENSFLLIKRVTNKNYIYVIRFIRC